MGPLDTESSGFTLQEPASLVLFATAGACIAAMLRRASRFS
jgi:hypothetical protein